MKIAIVHDYLAEYGGAERVVAAMCEAFPQADLFVAFIDRARLGKQGEYFAKRRVKTTWLQFIPGIKKIYSPLRILAPWAFSCLNLRAYDVVISSTNAYFAKAVKVKTGAVHFCYCHTPARSLYGYSTQSDWRAKPLINFFGKISNHFLRLADWRASQKVTYFLANSETTAARIKKFYRRDSQILYPPIILIDELAKLPPPKHSQEKYYLYVNRLNFAKHPELAIQACLKMGRPLYVVGSGAMEAQLREQYGSEALIKFCGSVSDHELATLYQNARALIYPVTDEDFGIVPVEAMGAGLPVIAHRSGGPLETILENVTGVFFDGDLADQKQSQRHLDHLIAAIKTSEEINWQPNLIKKHASRFSQAHFTKKLQDLITKSKT